ncbi:hypothetical protein [Leeuwenhoekiella sp. W20_SRS_FM14]|uniref:hypothetical protein n=1 Tax=Leeuwenhoekiella sp. W20_SRS_FM14 TaxID=3240270 RepID=UPI003F9D0F18
MKATKLLLLLVLGIILACTDDDLSNQENQDFTSFVRFNFLVNSNNEPLEFPEVTGGRLPVSSYTNTSLKTVKIPVSMSSRSLEGTITAAYEIASTLPATAYTAIPEQLSFTATQPTDTIFVTFNDRWTGNDELEFTLTSVSDASVQLGNLNTTSPNTTFTLALGDINTSYRFNTSRIELAGTAGETTTFRVEFPAGYIASEIDDASLFQYLNGFDFDLERSKLGVDFIEYTLTLNENLANDDVNFQSIVSLAPVTNYQILGNSNLLVIKPIKTNRVLATNPASHFYDISNPFYLARGENWIDHDNDGLCTWRSWTAFAVPVVVSADDPNAILGSDNGTPETDDDIYYDAFKMGFKSSLPNRTTNPFNLQRWFDNESTNADTSPGFNIETAIEFFPENGTNTTQGTVSVIPQFLAISSRDDKLYEFAISGSGTYRQVNATLWEIKMQLRVTNEELYGGTITSEYFIYSDRGYDDPVDLPGNSCVNEIEL